MNPQILGGIILSFVSFVLLPIHIQKRVIRAIITGGTSTSLVNGQPVATARFGGYEMNPGPEVKRKLADWQLLLLGAMVALFIVSATMGEAVTHAG